MEELFNIANEEYFIDLDKISELIRIEPSIDEILDGYGESTKEDLDNNGPEHIIVSNAQMMDVAKWEVVKALLESLLNENGIIDESMGIKKLESQLSIPFRLSFNTLLKHKIIKKNG